MSYTVALLKVEFKRLFRSLGFYVSVMIGIIISVMQFITYVIPRSLNVIYGFDGTISTYPFSVYNSWIGVTMGFEAFSTSFLYICILLASIPFCITFCIDKKNGYVNQLYIRASGKNVHIAKFIVTFVSGGITVLIPVLLNYFVTLIMLPALKPVQNGLFVLTGNSFIDDLFYNKPELFTFIYLVGFFMYGGAFSVTALVAAYYFDSVFLVLITPFVVFYGLNIISDVLGKIFAFPSISPMLLMAPTNGTGSGGLVMYILEPLILITLCGAMFLVKYADAKNDLK